MHGGNSPQERIIPVLTVTRKRTEQPGYVEYAVEVEPKSDVMGLHWLRVRVGFAKNCTTSLAFVAAKSIDLTLRAIDHTGVQVVWKEIAGAGALKGGRLRVPLGEEWTDVFFGLTGPQDDRVRIEIYHADNVERVQAATPEQWYSVSGQSGGASDQSSPRSASSSWAELISDEGIRKVFLHVEKHAVITEPEIIGLLGSPRAFRRFSVEFDEYLAKLPFKVRTETGEGGKRYVREGSSEGK